MPRDGDGSFAELAPFVPIEAAATLAALLMDDGIVSVAEFKAAFETVSVTVRRQVAVSLHRVHRVHRVPSQQHLLHMVAPPLETLLVSVRRRVRPW